MGRAKEHNGPFIKEQSIHMALFKPLYGSHRNHSGQEFYSKQ